MVHEEYHVTRSRMLTKGLPPDLGNTELPAGQKTATGFCGVSLGSALRQHGIDLDVDLPLTFNCALPIVERILEQIGVPFERHDVFLWAAHAGRGFLRTEEDTSEVSEE